MSTLVARLRESRSWWFDLTILGAGVVTFVAALVAVGLHDWADIAPALAAIPLIMVIAHYPMVLDNGKYGIEVGFDSTILIFLLCTTDVHDAVVVWSLGAVLTQAATSKRLLSKLFNIGVGILAGSCSAGVLVLVRGDALGTPRELLAVALAAAAYFATDFVASAVSVAISAGTRIRDQFLQSGTLLAVACFVPFDMLGYLAAVVYRDSPWWALSLLGVPVVTLLVATRALTRGRENARRLTVLLDASVRAQTLTTPDAVSSALLEDARALVRLSDVSLRAAPPGRGEIGAEVDRAPGDQWIVVQAKERARSTVIADEQALQALAAVASEAFARIELTAEMVHVARHDPLTDLPNRGILGDRLSEALTDARRRGTRVALVVLDLDGFKQINDRFGHATGDLVLVELAHRLEDCVRGSDTVARLGGDEFAILVEDADSVPVEALCDRVLRVLGRPVRIGAQELSLGVSIGLTYGDLRSTGAGMARQADLAMYEAKARGKARWVRYEPAIGRARLDRLELVEDLRQAIVERRLTVDYQPVVDVRTGRIVAAEALARWRRNGDPVPPALFVKIAEESDLILGLGEAVLEEVVKDSAQVHDAGGAGFHIGVNVSVAQLRDPGFVPAVRRAVEAMGGTGLGLEITERQGAGADPVVIEAIRRLAGLGVHFAIDDFGVGFSNIGSLHALRAQTLKVDASLVRNIDTDERSASLFRSVALMASSLGMNVVVEGIERQSQLDLVRAGEQPMFAQGFLLDRPMPLPDLVERLRAQDRPTQVTDLAAGA